MTKMRTRKPGKLPALQRVLWSAILNAQEILEDASDAQTALSAIHALSQASGQYAKLLQIGELEGRISALEAHMAR